MLERAIQTLLAPGGKFESDDREEKRAQTGDVLTYVQLVLDNSQYVAEKEASLTIPRKSQHSYKLHYFIVISFFFQAMRMK